MSPHGQCSKLQTMSAGTIGLDHGGLWFRRQTDCSQSSGRVTQKYWGSRKLLFQLLDFFNS